MNTFSIWKITLNPIQILLYFVAIIFGMIAGNCGTNKSQCNQLLIIGNKFHDKHRICDNNLRNTNNSKQINTFPRQKYSVDAYNQSFSKSFQNNLIISTAINSDLTTVYRFSRSVRASCALCTLVLLVTDATIYEEDFKDLADLYSIVYISMEEYTPEYLTADKNVLNNLMTARWIVINNYLLTLQAEGTIYDNVFICDSSDVLFQKDVFAYMNDYTPGLYAFMEDVRMTIGTCKYNSDWIQKCYGDVELQNLFDESISCAGTVLGTWSAIMSYLSILESEMLKAPIACKAVGSDQGSHNYIIHNRKIPNVTIHYISHEYGFVGTLGYVLWMKRNQFGLVQNANGSVYAVIHQWNRSKQMKDQFKREYQIIPSRLRNRKN